MTEPKDTSVSLPAGSYEYDALAPALDKAVKIEDEGKRRDAITSALDKGSAGEVTSRPAPNAIPGMVPVDVLNQQGGTETVQIFAPPTGKPEVVADPLEPEEIESANADAIKETVADARKSGEVASEPEVEPMAPAAKPAGPDAAPAPTK